MRVQHEIMLLLKVQTDYFQAGAIWRKIYGIWSCTHAARVLSWMRGLSPSKVKIALLKMDARFSWIPISPVKNSQSTLGLSEAAHQYANPSSNGPVLRVETQIPPVPGVVPIHTVTATPRECGQLRVVDKSL